MIVVYGCVLVSLWVCCDWWVWGLICGYLGLGLMLHGFYFVCLRIVG